MTDLYQQIAALSPEQRALFEQRLKQRGIQLDSTLPVRIPKRAAATEIPLSFAQQRLWFIQQLDPENASYNVPSALKLTGPLHLVALQQTFDHLVQRHESLRTRFILNADQQPIQTIDPPKPVHLPLIDLSNLPDPDPQVQLLIQAAANTPFDLSQALLRLLLIRLDAQQHILLVTVHHIISDRWSVGVFLRELTILYNAFAQNQPSPLPDLPIQAADWAVWQRQQLQGERLDTQIAYWQQQLHNLSELELPTDYPRPAVPSYRGTQYPITLSQVLSDAVKSLAAQAGTTLFTVLLTAFQILLHRYTQQDDIVIGTDIANRDRSETAGLIGLLVNTIVLRTDLSGNPRFHELLERTKGVMRDAIAHQELPFEKLVEVLNPERSLSQMMPLFQVKLDLQLAAVQPPHLTGLKIERLASELTTVKYELRLNLQDTDQGIQGQIEYSTDLFEHDTIARLAGHFQTLLTGIVADPEQHLSDLPLLTPAEQQQLADWSRGASLDDSYPDGCIHSLFEAQVERTPDSIALIWQDQQLTYRYLNAEANGLAHYLLSLGILPETKVAVCLERTPQMVIALLAILKAGAAYVPLDPAYPQERHRFIFEDAAVNFLITESNLKRGLPDYELPHLILLDQSAWKEHSKPYFNKSSAHTSDNPNVHLSPAHLAYLIYTS
ncbi:MAG: AMP-binding protein, partial [Synechococcales cyanobacterium M58_A2018_015]|nr:AMP-binding protein [Synechococcales cyanobacterium M58_A2018_015]